MKICDDENVKRVCSIEIDMESAHTNGWMNDLRLCVLFNNISFIPERWGDMITMKRRFSSERITPNLGL